MVIQSLLHRRLVKTCLLLGFVLSSLPTRNANALLVEVGPATQFAASAVDHSKLGARLGLTLWEESPWSVSVQILSSLRTFTSVNPGAQSPSAPDLSESYAGDNQLFGDLWVQGPWHVLPQTELGFGFRTWLPNPNSLKIGFFPAPGIRLKKAREKNHTGWSLDYALMAATDLRLLNAEPEFAFVFGLGPTSSLRLVGSVSAFQNLRGAKDSFLIPRAALTWAKDF